MIAAYLLLVAILLWALFLMYCALNASIKSGKLALTPWPVQLMSYALLAVMVTVDIVFNITAGSIVFAELPSIRQPTFTQRCSSHLDEDGWRGRLARWICNSWLNPFEQGHCR